MLDNVIEFKRPDEIDLRPLLGEIGRQWQRISPYDLTVPEMFTLLRVLGDITDRLDAQNERTQHDN